MIFPHELQNSLYFLCRDIYSDVTKEQIIELYNTLLKVYLTQPDYHTFKNYVQEYFVTDGKGFVLTDDAIYVEPDTIIPILYGLYYVSDMLTPTNIRNMDIPNILLSMIQFLDSSHSDYNISDLFGLFNYKTEVTKIHYDYMVITTLQTINPYCSNLPFLLSEISDDIQNHDLICCRDTYPHLLDDILMNYGCFKNRHGYYIYP